MEKLFRKHELLFSILFIVIYVVLMSVMEELSFMVGISKIFVLLFSFVLSMILLIWIKKNNHQEYFGLTLKNINYKQYLYFIPLLMVITSNLWLGFAFNYTLLEGVIYFITMLFVGLLEEIIFRGFLFKAMSKDNMNSAIIVSSITFGLGHIINLFNGSAISLLDNILQIISAIAFGFLFVMIFIKSKSIIPCIITHSLLNACSTFLNHANMTTLNSIIISSVLTLIALSYAFYIYKLDNKKGIV
jgi:membrane protease YdiL (CAAX protease family)